ncbi:MAG: hypothetical protein AVDCRST_MAG62-882 [uncultured Sphingomonas sp.]|uniref:Uncharacterized protein n=1 Tax=uncultured Sphingomonas sp. TaxID=158754 RepID=A0A6J4T9X4_9SPHN|nr:MAG: hypothetical protein AVDCRST_MAG62-882 [uncultured Sphingomonas sp.]
MTIKKIRPARTKSQPATALERASAAFMFRMGLGKVVVAVMLASDMAGGPRNGKLDIMSKARVNVML